MQLDMFVMLAYLPTGCFTGTCNACEPRWMKTLSVSEGDSVSGEQIRSERK